MRKRKVIISPECNEFINSSSNRARSKFGFLVEIVIEQKLLPKNFVEKLTNTEFYELKIKVENQIRIILFTLDAENINESEEVIFLNGFIKKNYLKAIKEARKNLNQYLDEKK